MMTMSMTLITSRDPKGRQTMSIIEAAYDKAKLDDDSAQLLNERGDELKAGVSELIAKLSITNQYADEEVESSYGYLSGYDKPKSLQDQATILRKMFPELGECDFALGDKELPDGAEGPRRVVKGLRRQVQELARRPARSEQSPAVGQVGRHVGEAWQRAAGRHPRRSGSVRSASSRSLGSPGTRGHAEGRVRPRRVCRRHHAAHAHGPPPERGRSLDRLRWRRIP